MDRNNWFTMRFFFQFLLILALSCQFLKDPDPRYGLEFNEERKKIGLPILDSTWILWNSHERSFCGTGCVNFYSMWSQGIRRPTTNKPYYSTKLVYYNDSIIIREVDTYNGTTRFKTLDGSSIEQLFITYFFAESRWKYELEKEVIPDLENYRSSDGKIYSSSEIFIVTKEEADSVLKHWGIDRPWSKQRFR